jgi:hypothetical protein
MRKMKRIMAIMLLAMVASVCAPQAFAGVIHNPGPDPAPAAAGEMQNGIMYPGFSGWIGTGLYAGIVSFFG